MFFGPPLSEVSGSATVFMLVHPLVYLNTVADPETSEGGGGKKHEI